MKKRIKKNLDLVVLAILILVITSYFMFDSINRFKLGGGFRYIFYSILAGSLIVSTISISIFSFVGKRLKKKVKDREKKS